MTALVLKSFVGISTTLCLAFLISTALCVASLLVGCGKSGGDAASSRETDAKSRLSRAEKSMKGGHDMTDWQKRKMAEIGKSVPGKSVVEEQSGQGYTYRVRLFEDGKYKTTATHRLLSEDYADRYESERESMSVGVIEEADKARRYIRSTYDEYKYRGKTWQEVRDDVKAWVDENIASAAKYNIKSRYHLVE
ncbi:MAG: hypothetical protein LBI02_03150 [Opitutaceae bacterium]|jgi:hypothetical protein|nr:hypothetical protein [Opitutaceae bacterium]